MSHPTLNLSYLTLNLSHPLPPKSIKNNNFQSTPIVKTFRKEKRKSAHARQTSQIWPSSGCSSRRFSSRPFLDCRTYDPRPNRLAASLAAPRCVGVLPTPRPGWDELTSRKRLLGAAPRSGPSKRCLAATACTVSVCTVLACTVFSCTVKVCVLDSIGVAGVSLASVSHPEWMDSRAGGGENTNGCRPGGNDRASALRKAIVSAVSSLVAACLAGRASQTRACREDLRSNSKITRSNRGSRGHSKRKGTEVRSPFRTRVRTRAGEARADRGVPHRMPSADPLDNGKPRGMEALGSGSL